MIISASRRTDIPAFYGAWFMNRVRAGFCTVRNPFNPAVESRVSLLPQDVAAIAFWTRWPAPLLPHLQELADRGLRFFFLFTITGNARAIEGRSPAPREAIDIFRKLSERLGPHRVIWRYDPIVLSPRTGVRHHGAAFRRLADQLRGATTRCIVSPLATYRKNAERLRAMPDPDLVPANDWQRAAPALIPRLSEIGRARGIALQSCASDVDFSPWGVPAGKCIDDAMLRQTFGLNAPARKDPSQRPACRCIASRDIGAYDSCLFGCAYCYATGTAAKARANHARHRPDGPALLP
jgi:hypothetical protein